MADWPAALSAGRYTALGEAAATSTGTTVTSGASNVEGAYAQLDASTPFDASGFIVTICGSPSPADCLVDIAIGAAASETILVPDILISGNDESPRQLPVPIPIKAGTRLSARVQSTDASDTVKVGIHLVKGGFLASAPCGRITNYGSTAADSGGIQVDPGATINTKGAYAEITASLVHPTKYVVVMIGSRNNSVIGANIFVLLDLAVGAAGSEQIVVPDLFLSSNPSTDSYDPAFIPLELAIKAGQRVAARAQSNSADATDRLFDIALLGIE